MAKKKIITTNSNPSTIFRTSSGTVLTTTNTNVSHSIWSTTSTNTVYNPNIGNQFVYNTPLIEPTPFHINFSWDGKTVDVTLKNGNDIFKLANVFMEWMDANEIEYKVKTTKKKK